MNIGYLIDLIKADAKLLDDVDAFLKKMNEKNITVVTKTQIVVAETEDVFSLADRNGGELTQADIDYAQKLIAQEPLNQKIEEKLRLVRDAISSGEVLTEDAINVKLKEISGK